MTISIDYANNGVVDLPDPRSHVESIYETDMTIGTKGDPLTDQ